MRVMLALALAALAVAIGCSTARQRESPTGPTSLLKFRDPDTRDFFSHVYRSGNLYLNFRPALVVDAIVEDRKYRDLYVKTLGERFLLPPPEIERLRAEQGRRFDTQVDILVFTYEGTHKASDLKQSDAPWRLLLRDDDGQVLTPLGIERIRSNDPEYLYIEKYFSGMDRWSRVYRVSFPKLAKRVLGRPLGDKPFQLLVTGIKGTVTLQWDDPSIFYRGEGS